MSDLYSINGRLEPVAEGAPDGIYLYRRMRAVDRKPLHAEAHAALLRDASRALFGTAPTLSAGRIADEAGALLRANGYPAVGGATLTLRLYADGTRTIAADGVSLYREYALRSLRPAAAVVVCEACRSEWPTSARREAARWARQEAVRRGAQCALLCDGGGIVRRADDAPLFAVRDDTLLTSPAPPEVERQLVVEAARRAGIRFVEEPIGVRSVESFDELFFFDCEGVCSIAACGDALYLSLKAGRIADTLRAMCGTR